MRNRIVDGAGGVIAITVGGGAVNIAAVSACATAVPLSVNEGGAGPRAGAGAGGPAAAGAAAATKPVAESAMPVPHCR